MPRRAPGRERDDDGDESGGPDYIGGAETVVPVDKQPDPLVEFKGWNKEEVRRFLRLAAKMVRYVDHWEYEDGEGGMQKLSVERFQKLTSLSVVDLFTEMEEKAKAHFVNAKAEDLPFIRQHAAYVLVRDDLTAKLTALRDGQNVEELAKFFESSAAIETAQTMFFAKKPRDRDAAAAQFMDRLAPKKNRGEGNTLVVVLPPGQEDVMRRTMQIMGGTFEVDPAISAKRVRVPELPAAPEQQ